MTPTDSQAALAALHEELLAVARDQQALAEALGALCAGPGASDAVIRRLQEFDLLRQRVELLAAAAVEIGSGDGDWPRRLLQRMRVQSVRNAFARHLGAGEEAVGGPEVELF